MNDSEEKDKFRFKLKMFYYLGIDPNAGIEYLENKETNDIDPQHVTALGILKGSLVPSS
jgi:hypothetical protein